MNSTRWRVIQRAVQARPLTIGLTGSERLGYAIQRAGRTDALDKLKVDSAEQGKPINQTIRRLGSIDRSPKFVWEMTEGFVKENRG